MRNLILTFTLCALAIAVQAAETNITDQFYNAVRRDDASTVQTLLRAGAGVNVKDSRDRTPLMYATAVGSEAMMRRLIEAGADVNAKTSFDATALMWCSNSLPRVKLLVEHGADVNARRAVAGVICNESCRLGQTLPQPSW